MLKICPVLWVLVLAVLIGSTGCFKQTQYSGFKVDPSTQMVVGRYRVDKSHWYCYLTRIDLKTNKILVETPTFENAVGEAMELSDGTVAFSYLRAPGTVQHKVGLIDVRGRYRDIRTRNDDASFVLGYLNQLTIWSGANYSNGDFVEWMDTKGKNVTKDTLVIHPQSMTRLEGIAFDPGNRLFLIAVDSHSRFYPPGLAPMAPYGFLVALDPIGKKFRKMEWPYFWTNPALCMIPSQKILLVAPNVDERHAVGAIDHVKHQIDFVTYPEFKLIQSIQLPGMAWEITYAPESNKAYVRVERSTLGLKSGIAVIDVTTQKMIRFLEMPCSSIRYVGLNRLAVCTWDQRKEITKDPTEACSNYRLLLFYTQTDKVVATFPGQYDRIGHDSEIETAAY